jgi:hypothetical protein
MVLSFVFSIWHFGKLNYDNSSNRRNKASVRMRFRSQRPSGLLVVSEIRLPRRTASQTDPPEVGYPSHSARGGRYNNPPQQYHKEARSELVTENFQWSGIKVMRRRYWFHLRIPEIQGRIYDEKMATCSWHQSRIPPPGHVGNGNVHCASLDHDDEYERSENDILSKDANFF